ncbi:ICP0-binding domain of ubiquitin-specific protease 7-domain-containing protein [Gigaspora rosea]|uniref:ICP0-binding domain of ubiquitin-specific protease 7-domain-containing protein n=1 Tax=Gigaspora rosea TaxID=44941 RepID=A0A397V109_9GLOM|nr:ICP0-binding domain of ubiquitin-specific protease 7-domain-containing protein [Gigaspora rosea]
MTTKFFDQLCNNLTKLLENSDEHNVIIKVGQDPNIQAFKAHSIILNSRCLYFKDKLAAITYNDNNMKIIDQTNVSIEIFDIIIRYIYNGVISLETINESTIFELLLASSEFGLKELIKHLQLSLIMNHASWLRLNFSSIYQASLKDKNLRDLQQFYDDIIAKGPIIFDSNFVFDSDEFLTLSENTLILILKLENLQMDEGKIWDYIIKWGIAQNPFLPSNLAQWSNQHFLALKNSLKNCLPLIRYFQISGEDIFDKVWPYRNILEPSLWEDIMIKFMAPNRTIVSHILPPRVNSLTIPSSQDNITIDDNSASTELRNVDETCRIMVKREESFVELMDIEPNYTFALNNRGITYLNMIKSKESFVDSNKSLEIEPDDTFALRIRGTTYHIEERSLFLHIKIVTPDIFERHQGFDLANFNNKQYPLSEIPQFRILKNETYWAFKAMVARRFGIMAEQLRFWVFTIRENKTFRLNKPISDDSLAITMEEVHKQRAAEQNELKLFMEVTNKPINNDTWFPSITNYTNTLIIFIKFYNPDTQSLEGLCHLYVDGYDKVCKILPILCEKKTFPPNTPLNIYHELPNSIQEMKINLSFRESKIQNGDVICFQRVLTENEALVYTAKGFIHNISIFYKLLYTCMVVQFKPKYEDQEQKPEFELVLNLRHKYDDVAKFVAKFLGIDPLKLQFTTAQPVSGKPQAVIERKPTQTLKDMLQKTYMPNSPNLLYYEMLDIVVKSEIRSSLSEEESSSSEED